MIRKGYFVACFGCVLGLWLFPAALHCARSKVTVYGKYSGLITGFHAPEDRGSYGLFNDYGHYPVTWYKNRRVPAGFWVYVFPRWYVWRRKNLKKIGFERITKRIRLSRRTVTVYMEFKKGHARWGRRTLRVFTHGLQALEKMTGIPYPGRSPYTIFEDPHIRGYGSAGEGNMGLAAPPKGAPWVVLHEAVHIWNASRRPAWINEGLANFVSYLIMKRKGFRFYGDETWSGWIRYWRRIRNSRKDLPLNYPRDNYKKVRQGKAMEFWSILYRLFGPSLIRTVFRLHNKQAYISNRRFMRILQRRYRYRNPRRLLSGWVLPGPYRVVRAEQGGRVRFSIP